MRISEQWLREWVAPKLDTAALAQRLTLAGLEVSAIAPVAPPLTRVVVGKVLAVAAHPQAERLQVCEVDVGTARLSIVCGASNVRVGIHVPTALEGAELPNGVRIARSEIRGVMSEGMLCSAAELGLEDSSAGLMLLDARARVGQALGDYLQLDDRSLEIDLTPNRGDCLSVRGIARELAALTGAKLRLAHGQANRRKQAVSKQRSRIAVKVLAKQDCPRYVGCAIRGIDPNATTPLWMKERLRRSGVRSIHPVVDVTNYVMLELGQPMHAFDATKIAGGIQVRQAAQNEEVRLLDGSTIKALAGDLLIADRDKPLALAGVMGGAVSAVSAATRDIFLESAYFKATTISRCARRLGLHSESSHRFERGVDPALQRPALERAVALLCEIVGGKPDPIVEAVHVASLPKTPQIELRRARLALMLGKTLPDKKVKSILTGLGLHTVATRQGWRVTPPSYRFDIQRECDLIEEVARVFGYENLPSTLPSMEMLPFTSPAEVPLTRVRATLVGRDYHEVVTYSFVDPALQALLQISDSGINLKNPLASNMSTMRASLWPGLIAALSYNLNRQQNRLRLFEIGRRFRKDAAGSIEEIPTLAGLVSGTDLAPQWGARVKAADFFDVKGDIEALLALSGQSFEITGASHPSLHPGQCAQISRAGKPIGVLGQLRPELARKLDIAQPVYVYELDIVALQQSQEPIFREISRFPSVRRDLAVVVERATPAATILNAIREVAGNLLANLELFDDYRGEGIDSGRKSLALTLTFQDSSRTLKEEAVETLIAKVMAALQQKFGAQLRQ